MIPWDHAKSSAKRWGGVPENYIEIHDFLDSTKFHVVSWHHRAILHNTFGVGLCEKIFGHVIINSEGRQCSVRHIAIQHIQEDVGFVPNIKEWLGELKPTKWMIAKPEKDETHGE